MTRKKFFLKYYEITNLSFPDRFKLTRRYISQEEWQKGQIAVYSKGIRKVMIVFQYLLLLFCWMPMLSDKKDWVFIPICLLISFLISVQTDFSIIKIEVLYRAFRKDNVYSVLLYDIFCRNFDSFVWELKRATKKVTTGYCADVFLSRGHLYRYYKAICRDKNKEISLIFHTKGVIIKINGQKRVIDNMLLSRDQLIKEIASVINGMI